MKWVSSIIRLLAILCWVFVSCDKDNLSNGKGDDDVVDGVNHEEPDDYSWDSLSEVAVTLNGTSIHSSSANVVVSGTTATISAAGNYRITGLLTNGQLVVDASDNERVRLILNGVTISNTSGSAVVIKNTSKTIIYLVAGTTSTISDGTTYTSSDEDLNAAILSKSDLTIFGEGALVVKGNYCDGISSKDGLLLKSGTYNIAAKDDGIRGKDYLIIEGGDYTVVSGGDGLKSDNETSSEVGYIRIDNGNFNITSAGDAISAATTVTSSGSVTFTIKSGGGSGTTTNGYAGSTSAKGIKGLTGVILKSGDYSINSADDAIHSNSTITINGGIIQIATNDDAVHAENSITINDGTITVTKSFESIESKSITINGGTFRLVATNDGINATAGLIAGGTEQNDGSLFTMTAGYLHVNCSNGDAIDSNGNVKMTGGTIVACGPSSGVEEAADVNGSFTMNGGFFIGTGSNSNMNKAMSTASTQLNLYIISSRSQIQTGSIFRIQTADATEIVTFKPVRGFYSVLFSSGSLARNVTYSIYIGGTCTGTETDGLFSNGTYSGGILKKSFTLSTSSTVTSVSL